MTLPAHIRRSTILAHEGQLLSMCSGSGPAVAADIARCVADGALNAIIRIEGAESASAFAFGLADRVAGGLKDPTPVFAAARPAPTEDDVDHLIAEVVDREIAARAPRRDTSILTYLLGVGLAFFVGFVIGQGWR